jgi:catechol 2,3-dioxygenase-like lactoylglutathione lyase family enzyme
MGVVEYTQMWIPLPEGRDQEQNFELADRNTRNRATRRNSMIRATRVTATIPVADLARAVRWYKDKLGLEPAKQDQNMGAVYNLPGGTGFNLYPTPTNAGKAPNTLMGFEVADVAAEVAALRKSGVVFENYDMPGLKTVDGIATMGDSHGAWFKDVDGNILALGDGLS